MAEWNPSPELIARLNERFSKLIKPDDNTTPEEYTEAMRRTMIDEPLWPGGTPAQFKNFLEKKFVSKLREVLEGRHDRN